MKNKKHSLIRIVFLLLIILIIECNSDIYTNLKYISYMSSIFLLIEIGILIDCLNNKKALNLNSEPFEVYVSKKLSYSI